MYKKKVFLQVYVDVKMTFGGTEFQFKEVRNNKNFKTKKVEGIVVTVLDANLNEQKVKIKEGSTSDFKDVKFGEKITFKELEAKAYCFKDETIVRASLSAKGKA